jgi:putative transposase
MPGRSPVLPRAHLCSNRDGAGSDTERQYFKMPRPSRATPRAKVARKERPWPTKKSRFTDQQVAFALQQAEGGTPVEEVCRKLGVSQATFFRWKKVYGGLMPSEVRKLRHLEEENTRLRKLVADLTLDKEMLSEVIKKKI